jgi:hypothetical protein
MGQHMQLCNWAFEYFHRASMIIIFDIDRPSREIEASTTAGRYELQGCNFKHENFSKQLP